MKNPFNDSFDFTDFLVAAPHTGSADSLGGGPAPSVLGAPIVVPEEELQAEAAVTASGTGAPGSTVTVASSAGLTINLVFDNAAMAAPQAFRDGITQAMQMICAVVTDHVTLNLQIDYSGTGRGAYGGPSGGNYISYSTVRADLVNNASPGDTTFNSLPTGSTIAGQSQVAVWYSQEKLWGLISPTGNEIDGSASFATDISPSLLVGVALHELTHAMGRVPYAGSAGQPDIFDFDRFTSPGNILVSGSNTAPPAYFSLNNGASKIADYGQTSDPSDFLNSGVQGSTDPFNEFYSNSTQQSLTAIDLKQLDALGFHLTTGNHAPIVTATAASVAASPGQSLAIASLFTASDPDGDTMTYMIYDASTGAGHGHFLVNGTVVAAGNPNWVTQAQLAQTSYVAGTSGTSDDVRLIAYDGQLYSGNGVWTKLTVNVTGADPPPQISLPSGSSVSEHDGVPLAVTTLFSASDPDGNALSYMIYDATTTAGHGHFEVNGTVVPQATPTWVTQAQLAQTVYVPGSIGTTDDVRMIAYDGQLYSNSGIWSKVLVTAADAPPQMSLPSGSVVSTIAGNSIAIGSLFSASDPDGDTLMYMIDDVTTAAGHGHFVVNGTVIAQATPTWVTQAQLAQTTFVAGTAGSSDDVRMIAYDGQLYSNNGVWSKVQVNGGALTATAPQPAAPSSAGAFDSQNGGSGASEALHNVLNDFFHNNAASGGFAFSSFVPSAAPQTAAVTMWHHDPAAFDFAALNHGQPEAANTLSNSAFGAALAGTPLAGVHDDHATSAGAFLHDFHILT